MVCVRCRRSRLDGAAYNQHRYYDPQSGRYISKDPIGLAGGVNVYAYGRNPITWIDPKGLEGTDTLALPAPTSSHPWMRNTPNHFISCSCGWSDCANGYGPRANAPGGWATTDNIPDAPYDPDENRAYIMNSAMRAPIDWLTPHGRALFFDILYVSGKLSFLAVASDRDIRMEVRESDGSIERMVESR